MRILLMGAKGMLGTDMLRVWQGHEVIAADSAEADIRDLHQVRCLIGQFARQPADDGLARQGHVDPEQQRTWS